MREQHFKFERRRYKNSKCRKAKKKYQQLRNKIKSACKKAKEERMKGKWDEIETLIGKSQMDLAYRKVRVEFGKGKKKAYNITDKREEPIYAAQDKVLRWVEYIEKLYDSNDKEEIKFEEEADVDIEKRGDPILRSEFNMALNELNWWQKCELLQRWSCIITP